MLANVVLSVVLRTKSTFKVKKNISAALWHSKIKTSIKMFAVIKYKGKNIKTKIAAAAVSVDIPPYIMRAV